VYKNLTLTRHKVEALPKVNEFLNSIQRNSKDSKNAYHLGLTHFQDFLDEKYPTFNVETILERLTKNEINVYELLNNFVSFLMVLKLSVNSLILYLTAVRSYFGYYDIDVIPSKFKRRVKMPKVGREDEEPLDAKDIRKILLSCNNRRLKTFILILASGGMRTKEGLAIRLKDIDLSLSPTKIHIRKEFSKTRVARDIYISDEATHYLKQWIDWKYRDKRSEWTKTPNPNDLIFAVYSVRNEPNPNHIYVKIILEFEKLLTIAGMDDRKEGMRRRKITLHSFRRFVKTVISDQTNQDYSEWFLGHSKSPYYTKKEHDRREIYATKCMKYVTFLDYTMLESTGKNIEAKLSEKDKEIEEIRSRFDLMQSQMQSLLSSLGSMQDQNQVNQMAKTLYNSKILKTSSLKDNDN
jgi:integrase